MSIQPPTILIVEKDAATRDLYRRELLLDYQVFACADGEETRQALTHHRMDVAIVEPTGCGWDLVDELKGKMPLIVCSTQEVSGTHSKMGLAAYLVKPVLPADLSKLVQLVLADVLEK